MAKVSWRNVGLVVAWLKHVFDGKAGSAHAAKDLFPAVQVFKRPFFTVWATDDRRERTFAEVGLLDEVAWACGLHIGLQARGRFVLADVETAGAQDLSDLLKDRRDFGDVASANWVDDDVELTRRKHGEVIHGGLDDLNAVLTLGRDLAVKF